ncbi:MAG: exodeoxyribonuclease III [Planctomycetaceae bacterium]|nr:exodeoxyribonuclease III [Planctomycetaceae bacterium]
MRITTWNVNGLRAAIKKGFAEIIEEISPDVLLLQETRVLPEQLPNEWSQPDGWHVHWNSAERKGYSGTAVWSRQPMKVLGTGLNADDPEGRVLSILTQGVEIASVYLPSGSASDERQQVKEQWMAEFRSWADPLKRKRRPVVLGGDLNIAHTEKDIFYAKSNRNTSGFLAHEREWIGELFEAGWNDFIRQHYGDIQGPYSWWSNRGRARELDRGWRIDYLIGNRAAAKRIQSASIHRGGGLTVSDHAPVTIDLSEDSLE